MYQRHAISFLRLARLAKYLPRAGGHVPAPICGPPPPRRGATRPRSGLRLAPTVVAHKREPSDRRLHDRPTSTPDALVIARPSRGRSRSALFADAREALTRGNCSQRSAIDHRFCFRNVEVVGSCRRRAGRPVGRSRRARTWRRFSDE